MTENEHDSSHADDRSRAERVQALYKATLEHPRAERAEYLRASCSEDESLRDEIIQMLGERDAQLAHEMTQLFAEGSAIDRSEFEGEGEGDELGSGSGSEDRKEVETPNEFATDPAVGPDPETPHAHWFENLDKVSDLEAARRWIGRTVGGVTIQRLIDSGGMGAVFEGLQKSPRRTVALKILREAIPSEQMQRRFEFEAQTLARMDHPGIASIHAADVFIDNGIRIPFFVMEYIRGARSITEYASVKDLNLRERLELFEQACAAIGHAHQKGVIHRDLKPANILVDSRGQLQVIDFGVARSIDADQMDTIYQTRVGQLIGTPGYMAPEQFDLTDDLDARVDVYALGIVLYELLCDRAPYDVTNDISTARHVIQTVEPTRPSTIDRRLRGDLESVLLKALEKDRDSRYRDASAFGDDIGHALRDEPVTAQSPTLFYTLRKVARRHRPLVGASAGAIMIIIVAAIISTTFFFRERSARSEATKQAQLALEKTAQLQQVVDFQSMQLSHIDPEMVGIRMREDLLTSARHGLAARKVTGTEHDARLDALMDALLEVNLTDVGLQTFDRNVLAPTLETIESEFSDQPIVRAQLLETVAITAMKLGLYDRALPPQEEVVRIHNELLGADDPRAFSSTNTLIELLIGLGRFDDANSLCEDVHQRSRSILGPHHLETLRATSLVAQLSFRAGDHTGAEAHYRSAYEGLRTVLGEAHPDTAMASNALAITLANQGKAEEAEACYRDVIAVLRRDLGDEDLRMQIAIGNLGHLLSKLGRYSEAEELLRESLDIHRRSLGDEHPDTMTIASFVGGVLQKQGKYEETEAFYNEVLASRRRTLGSGHPDTIRSISNLGSLYMDQGRYIEAESYIREALASRRRILGNDNPETLESTNSLGSLFSKLGRFDEAEIFQRESLEGYRRIHGAEHPHALRALNNLGVLMMQTGRDSEAAVHFREIIEIHTNLLGDEHPATLQFLTNLASALSSQGKYDEAVECNRKVLAAQRRHFGDDNPDTLRSIANLGQALVLQGHMEEGLKYSQEALERRRRVLGDEHIQTIISINNVGGTLYKQGKTSGVEPYFRDAFAGFRRVLGEDHVYTIRSMYRLTSFLEETDRHEEALPLAVAYQQRVDAIDSVPHEEKLGAIDLLVEIHEALAESKPEAGHVSEARRWRDERQRMLEEQETVTAEAVNE